MMADALYTETSSSAIFGDANRTVHTFVDQFGRTWRWYGDHWHQESGEPPVCPQCRGSRHVARESAHWRCYDCLHRWE